MARKVFSSSFTISAACVDDTGITVSKTGSKDFTASWVQTAVSPPTTFGTLRTLNCLLAGSMRSGANASAKSSPTLRPRASRIGRKSSCVVPGYVVEPRITSWPARSRFWIASTAATMNEKSGSLVLVSGVGTQTLITSQPASSSKSVVACSLPASRCFATSACGTSSMYERPSRDRAHLLGVELEAGDGEARLRELDRERQPDIAEPHHPDSRLARFDAPAQIPQPRHVFSPGARRAPSCAKKLAK